MTTLELINQIIESDVSKNLGKLHSQLIINRSIKVLVDSIIQSLIKGQRIEIRGFGSFNLNYRLARVGYNPKTGEKIDIPARKIPCFKPGKELRTRVNLPSIK